MNEDTITWREFLEQWSHDVLRFEPEYVAELPPEVVASGWLGFAGASEADLADAEARLGITLPPSYRTFLATTNGFLMTSPFIKRVWSTDEVEWFAVRHRDWIDAYASGAEPVSDEEYFVYGPDQDSVIFRAEYLEVALEISDVGDSAIYLLNPQVVTPDGEWEAWLFANWLPGACRYRSFWEMMQAEFQSFLDLRTK